MLWMPSRCSLRKILLTVSQCGDLSKETLIGLFTMLTQKVGSRFGQSFVPLWWCLSGFTSEISTSLWVQTVLMMKITSDWRMPRLVWFGSVIFGLLLSRPMATICLLWWERSSFTLIIQMIPSWQSSHHTTSRTHMPQTDTIRDGDKWETWECFELVSNCCLCYLTFY